MKLMSEETESCAAKEVRKSNLEVSIRMLLQQRGGDEQINATENEMRHKINTTISVFKLLLTALAQLLMAC